MRPLVLACLLAVPVAAQTVEAPPTLPPPDSTEAVDADPLPALTTADLLGETDDAAPAVRPYTSLGVASGWGTSVGLVGRVQGAAGVEFPSGLRVGGFASATTIGARSTTLAVGPELGYRLGLGSGVTLDARAAAGVAVSAGETFRGETYGARRLSVGTSVRLEREVPVVGSLRLAPHVGAYGVLGRRSAVDAYDAPAETLGSAGLLLGADVRFRLLGRDVSVPLTVPLSLVGRGAPWDVTGMPYGGAGLRLGF